MDTRLVSICSKWFKSLPCQTACALAAYELQQKCYWCCDGGNFYEKCIEPFEFLQDYIRASCDPPAWINMKNDFIAIIFISLLGIINLTHQNYLDSFIELFIALCFLLWIIRKWYQKKLNNNDI